jgi:hypothetical protein
VEFITHPYRGTGEDFRARIENATASRIGLECLSYLESSLSRLPTGVQWVVQDLFAHPRRYKCGADLAIGSAQRERTLWHWIRSARLGTPHRLVTVAKILHGCCYLGESTLGPAEISLRVGYASSRIFEENFWSVLGCKPLQLSKAIERRELIQHALEWLYKPSSKKPPLKRYPHSRINARVQPPLPSYQRTQ